MKITRSIPLFAALFALALGQLAAQQRPNILLIMADDMGYSDMESFGGEISTPNLDRLAEGGIEFTQFYNAARCCPTRASLLTGLYPHQAGIGGMTNDRGVPSYRGDQNKQCVTIAETLKESGYRTFMSGKWHVTKHVDFWRTWLTEDQKIRTSKDNWPVQRGFDAFFGTIHGACSYYNPATLTRNNTPFRLYKHYIHEGGIATPLIAYWPEGIQQASRTTDQLGHIIDIMPTIVEVTGASIPGNTRESGSKPWKRKPGAGVPKSKV